MAEDLQGPFLSKPFDDSMNPCEESHPSARGGKETLLLLLLTPTTGFVFCSLRVEGALLPHSSLWVCPALVPWHCLPWPEPEVERHKHQGEKKRKNKTEKGLLLQYFQPIKPRAGLLRESRVSQNPRPRGLKKWPQDLHPPCHQDPKGFGGAEHRHLQGCSAASAGTQARCFSGQHLLSTSAFPQVCVCVCTSEPPHPSQESSFWPRWLFPCHSSSFWEQKPATAAQSSTGLVAELGQGSSG